MKSVRKLIEYEIPEITREHFRGQSVGVAILDTGISLHPDFDHRIDGFRDFVNGRNTIYDDSGHGTHVAGILAGSGKMSDGEYAGIAPDAKLYIGKVLDENGDGKVDGVLAGILWIKGIHKQKNIKIVNISVGARPGLKEKEEQKLMDGVEHLWDLGMVVIVSAGNYGPKCGSVAVPGISRKVITVGAMLPSQITTRRNQKEWNYSGRGPTKQCVVKPDLLAPGTNVMSCNGNYTNRFQNPYIIRSGTSMATPVVSGAIACLLSKYPDMTNVEVKLRLRESCVRQTTMIPGWGNLNLRRLFDAAAERKSDEHR